MTLCIRLRYKFECLETSDGRKTGQLGIMWRNRYRVCVQLSQIFYNIGFGAGEAIAFSYCGCLGSRVLSGCSAAMQRVRLYSEESERVLRVYSGCTVIVL